MTLRLFAAGMLMLAMTGEVRADCSMLKGDVPGEVECLEKELGTAKTEIETLKKSNLQLEERMNKLTEAFEKHSHLATRMFVWIKDHLNGIGAEP